jgi:hypothetical protein
MDPYKSEKEELAQLEEGQNGHHHNKHEGHHKPSTAEEMRRIDALALAQGTTLASFSHLDQKKILRKMDIRLIPMLALLYLLSFLDRK